MATSRTGSLRDRVTSPKPTTTKRQTPSPSSAVIKRQPAVKPTSLLGTGFQKNTVKGTGTKKTGTGDKRSAVSSTAQKHGAQVIARASDNAGSEEVTEATPREADDELEKKDQMDVIEEAKSKLLENKKNKVLALVGAFETVMALQEPHHHYHRKPKETPTA